jgi:hypothetical protein
VIAGDHGPPSNAASHEELIGREHELLHERCAAGRLGPDEQRTLTSELRVQSMLRQHIRVRLRREHDRYGLPHVESRREDARYEQVGRVIQTARPLFAVQEIEIPRGLGIERSVATQDPERRCAVEGTTSIPPGTCTNPGVQR